MDFFTSMEALQKRFDLFSRQMAFNGSSPGDHTLWKSVLRSELRRLTGLDRIGGCAPETKLLERVELDGFTRDRMLLKTEDGVWMPFYVLLPGTPLMDPPPVVIAPHGHGFGGMEAVAGVRDNPDIAQRIDVYNCDYGLQLVRQGFMVFCPEARGFGLRRESTRQNERDALSSSCTQLNQMAIPLGLTVTGMWVHELIMLLNYVETRDDCDAGNVACAGLSGGGLQTLWFSALEERIRCCVVSGYFYGVRDSLLELSGNCSCNYVPGLWEKADMGDLGALVAPRPMLIETGDKDPLNGTRGVQNVTEQLEITAQSYRVCGAEDRLAHDIFDGEHRWNGSAAIPFLKKHLALQA